jgi:hypothetical protein
MFIFQYVQGVDKEEKRSDDFNKTRREQGILECFEFVPFAIGRLVEQN